MLMGSWGYFYGSHPPTRPTLGIQPQCKRSNDGNDTLFNKQHTE